MWPLESAVQAEGSFAFNRIAVAVLFASHPSLAGPPTASFVHAQKSGRRVPADCTDGGNWGKHTASIRMALWPRRLVRYVSHHLTSPTSFLHLLHKNNQRHVGSPCWVIGLAMAETRRFRGLASKFVLLAL